MERNQLSENCRLAIQSLMSFAKEICCNRFPDNIMFIKGYNIESCVKGDLSRMDEDVFDLIANNEIFPIESIIDDILEIQSRCENNVQKKSYGDCHIRMIDFRLFCVSESDTVIVVQVYYSPIPVEIKYHWSVPIPLSYREGEQFDLNWKYNSANYSKSKESHSRKSYYVEK